MKVTMINLITLILLLGCGQKDTSKNENMHFASDYKLFQNTPVWELAKVVKKDDSNAIRSILKKNKLNVDFREPVYDQTLLQFSVYYRRYNSVKALLESGANPNIQAGKDKMSPLMEAAQLGGGGNVHPFADARFLKILLKYGGDPNAVQEGDKIKTNKTFFTPLFLACLSGVFDYVKILIDSGANIQYDDKHGFNSLYASIVGGNPDITLFLLEKGADFRQPMYTNVKGEKKYILDALHIWHFGNNSKQYQTELKILNFLKAHAVSEHG